MVGSSDALKVVDFSTHFSGSVATRYLAHFGADVVKVENPRFGDGNRGNLPLIHGESPIHVALNAGKRSLTIDRRSDAWQPAVEALAGWADVVIYGAVPDAARHRGLDFETMAGFNDQIVHCLITGYGEVGPWRDLPSHGLNTDVYAGSVPIEMDGGYPVPRADYRSAGTTLAGIHAVVGIMEALRRRDLGAGAQRVSVSVWQSAMSWQWRDLTTEANLGVPMEAYSDLGARYAMYTTADDRIILVCPIEEKYWVAFCDVVGLPAELQTKGDWAGDGMDFGKGYDDDRAAIAERMAQHPRDHWVAGFEAAGIPFAPLLSTSEALASEQAEATNVMARTSIDGREFFVPNVPIGIAGPGSNDEATVPSPTVASPPGLGEHTEQVLGSLR